MESANARDCALVQVRWTTMRFHTFGVPSRQLFGEYVRVRKARAGLAWGGARRQLVPELLGEAELDSSFAVSYADFWRWELVELLGLSSF